MRGTWAEQHLFALQQALESWEHYQDQIAACDRQIARVMEALLASVGPSVEPVGDPPAQPPPATRKKASPNAPAIADMGGLMKRLCGGRDLAVLPACTSYSRLQLIGEVGLDLSAWPSAKH